MAMSPEEKAMRSRMRKDFPHYARKCLKIRTKSGKVEPLVLNSAQVYLHRKLEEQKAKTGKVRALVLKGRQQGCSTYVEGRIFHQVTHNRGLKAFILTHVDDATTNLFTMSKRFYDHCPLPLRPSRSASNAKELVFDKLDSGYKVGTAGSTGTGRSDTLQLFHGSEVAYWPNAETHVAGALQAVPDARGTEVILESTSAGRQGLFFDLCEKAMRGESDYILVFIPWFWQGEYRDDIPEGFVLTSEEEQYQHKYDVDVAQIAWRRKKIQELNGIHNFRREYPATPDEAFSAEVLGALWKRELIDGLRVSSHPTLKRVVVAVDPSGGDGAGHDEVGIIAAGLGHDGHGYLLNDSSGMYSPSAWGSKAVAVYHRLEADRLVAENNYGGAMVEHVVRTVDKSVSYKSVVATRGKDVRAEPVASLYEQGLIHHVGDFIALEDEQTTWRPGMKSPNRMDALVWAFTELMLGNSADGWVDHYRKKSEGQAAILKPVEGVDKSENSATGERRRTLRSLSPFQSFYASGEGGASRAYTSDESCFLNNVDQIHLKSLIAAGCIEHKDLGPEKNYLKKYVQYIINTAQIPLAIVQFDDDWAPAGKMIRDDLVNSGLITFDQFGLKLTSYGKSVV